MLRVGVDAWNLPHDRRGIGRYVRELLHVFAEHHADTIACTLIVPEWPAWTMTAAYRRALDGLALPLRSRREVRRARLDVLWFPFNGVSWEGWACPGIATLHDASPFELAGYDDAARAPFQRAAARCTRVITDSAYGADALARVLPYPRERIDPVLLGVAAPRPPEPVALDVGALGRFILFVGETEPRKGLAVLTDAVATLRRTRSELRLVAAGRGTDAAGFGAPDVGLGHVDDATLAALYRGCAAFAYPSRYEGFGLPVLEAMSYGAPVVASNAPSIPEAGGDAAAYVPPGDVAALAAALASIIDDPVEHARRRTAGLARAAAMTWVATARATVAAFQRSLH